MRSPESTIQAEIPITTTRLESGFGGHIDVMSTKGHGDYVLYGNGIVRSHESDVLRAMTSSTGRPGLVVQPGGRRDPAPVSARHDMVHVETGETLTVPRYSVAEAAAMLMAVGQTGESVDAVLQSQSAIAGIVAAYEQPSAINDMVLAYPAGIIKQRPKFIEAIRRARSDRKIWRQHRPDKDDTIHAHRGLADRVKEIRHGLRPFARARSAYALHSASLGPMLHEIKKRPNAPGITLLLGLDDHIFRIEEYIESLTASTDVDQIVIAPGAHAISGRPEILQLALNQLAVTRRMRDEGVDISTIPMRERIHFPEDIDAGRQEKILQLADELDARTHKISAQRATTKTS